MIDDSGGLITKMVNKRSYRVPRIKNRCEFEYKRHKSEMTLDSAYLIFGERRRSMHQSKLHITGGTAKEQLLAVAQHLRVLRQKWQLGDLLPNHVIQNDNVAMFAELGRPVQDTLYVDGGALFAVLSLGAVQSEFLTGRRARSLHYLITCRRWNMQDVG